MQETLLFRGFHSDESDGSSVSTGTTFSIHDSQRFCHVSCAIIGVCARVLWLLVGGSGRWQRGGRAERGGAGDDRLRVDGDQPASLLPRQEQNGHGQATHSHSKRPS